MKFFRSIRMALVVLGCFSLADFQARGQEQKPKTPTVVDCDLHAGAGPSSQPVYGRGFGRKESNRIGMECTAQRGRGMLYFDQTMAGAALIDNFDRHDAHFRIGYQLFGMNVQFRVDQISSLNNIPRLDPAARTPTSNINWTAIGIGHKWELHRFDLTSLEINAWRGIRGDMPLFMRSPSLPYVTQAMDVQLVSKPYRGFSLHYEPVMFTGDNFKKVRLQNTLDLQRTFFEEHLFGRGLVGMVGGTFNKNIGVPALTEAHGSALLDVGFKIPFGGRF